MVRFVIDLAGRPQLVAICMVSFDIFCCESYVLGSFRQCIFERVCLIFLIDRFIN